MSSFRQKSNKIKFNSEINTLDETHRKISKEFDKNHDDIPQKKILLARLKKEYESLRDADKSKLKESSIRKMTILKESIRKLESEIERIESFEHELDYYTKVSDTLQEYYSELNSFLKTSDGINIGENENPVTNVVQNKKLELLNDISKSKRKVKRPTRKRYKYNPELQQSKKTIIDYMNQPNDDKTPEKSQQSNQIHHHVSKKATLFDNFLFMIDSGYAMKNIKPTVVKFCEKCGIEKTLIQQEAIYVCTKCGEVENVLVESDAPNYKEYGSEKPAYPYRRINHLIERLNQLQAKESSEIPKNVYQNILTELKKNKVKQGNKITVRLMKRILKSLKFDAYYEHIPYIISKITHKPPPTLGKRNEERIKTMFMMCQGPFMLFRPKGRTNFLSYGFFMRKCLELLFGPNNEFLEYFPPLKSRDKLRSQEDIWKKMCNYLKWPYYSSI